MRQLLPRRLPVLYLKPSSAPARSKRRTVSTSARTYRATSSGVQIGSSTVVLCGVLSLVIASYSIRVTQAVVSAPTVEPSPAIKIRETELWIGANKRPEYPGGARLAVLDFPLSLPMDSTVTIYGVVFRVSSVGLIVMPDRAVVVYGLT